MEFAVYDAQCRRAGLIIGVALIVGMLTALGTFFLIPHGGSNVPPGSYLFLFPLTMILALFPLISIMTTVRIRVDRVTGEIFRLFTLFGHEVRRQRFNLSDFDRVSLNRGFRAAACPALLARFDRSCAHWHSAGRDRLGLPDRRRGGFRQRRRRHARAPRVPYAGARRGRRSVSPPRPGYGRLVRPDRRRGGFAGISSGTRVRVSCAVTS